MDRPRSLESREALARAYGDSVLLPEGFIVDEATVWELSKLPDGSTRYRASGRMTDSSRVTVIGHEARAGSRGPGQGWEAIELDRGSGYVKASRRRVEVVVEVNGTIVYMGATWTRDAAVKAARSLAR